VVIGRSRTCRAAPRRAAPRRAGVNAALGVSWPPSRFPRGSTAAAPLPLPPPRSPRSALPYPPPRPPPSPPARPRGPQVFFPLFYVRLARPSREISPSPRDRERGEASGGGRAGGDPGRGRAGGAGERADGEKEKDRGEKDAGEARGASFWPVNGERGKNRARARVN